MKHQTVDKKSEATEVIIPEVISDEMRTVIETLPKDKQEIILAGITKITTFSGPIPPPELLRGYEDILPGAADRIISMTEKQLDHRTSMESTIVNRTLTQKNTGMIFGFLIVLCILGIVVLLIFEGYITLAAILGTTTLLGVASIFVLGAKPNRPDKLDKIDE